MSLTHPGVREVKEGQEGDQEPGQFLPMSLCHPYLVSEVILHLLLTRLSGKAGPLRASSPFRICGMTRFRLGTTFFIEAAPPGSFSLHSGPAIHSAIAMTEQNSIENQMIQEERRRLRAHTRGGR